MLRQLGIAFGVSLLLLNGEMLTAQESCSLTIPVKAVGAGTTFFQTFQFREGTPSLPGLLSGNVEIGGQVVQEVKIRIARQVQREVVEYVVVYVDGRPTVQRRVSLVVETVYVYVPVLQEIVLPVFTGTWTSVDLCFYSTWNILHVGTDGMVVGVGTTVGNQLYGSALYFGVAGIPNGLYSLSTGVPGDGGGGGGGGGPPVEP
ncbi:MAG TPA: hypothetical protein VFV87_11625 [Pirellulaceae bacterium]|nr:hypothetical protein [Pirellulaceae bacterium]